jgi:hypothetical protein
MVLECIYCFIMTGESATRQFKAKQLCSHAGITLPNIAVSCSDYFFCCGCAAGYNFDPYSGMLSLQSTVNDSAAMWANSYGLNKVVRETLPQ